jgi:signal peptide peptidase SppA
MAKKIQAEKELWAGSLSTYHAAQEAEARILAGFSTSEPAEHSDHLTIIGNIGIVSIAGTLVNRDSPWNKYMGVISYNEIRAALGDCVSNPNIKQIVLDINSGGGAVNGISDVAALIAQINDNIKPVIAYTGGAMASGAYWLGVSAGRVVASDVSLVGSCGVITAHADLTAAYQEEGVKHTIIRAGKFKQLNSPLEPLSELGKEEMQRNVDHIYGVFVQHIADRRGVSYQIADTQMAQGREFIGSDAVKAGLVDSVTTFDGLMTELLNKVALDTNKSFSNNSLKSLSKAKIMTLSLSPEQLARISAGGTLTADEVAAATATAEAEAAALLAEKTPEELAAAAAEAEAAIVAAAAEGTTNEPNTPAANAVPGAETDVVAYLKAELATANANLLDTTVKLRGLEASSAEALANQTALLAIAAGSVNKMNVALGGTERDLSALSAVQVLAEHTAVSVDFNKKFKVGGVALSAASDTNADLTKATVTPLHTARVNATKVNKKEIK